MNPVILSTNDQSQAKAVLQALINEPSGTLTLVLILGNDAAAQKAKNFAYSQLALNPGSYLAIRFVFCEASAFILQQLQELPVQISDPHHPLDWNNYGQITVISISPATNKIADVLTGAQVMVAPGLIKLAILHALGI